MTVTQEINDIARKIKEEVNTDVDLSIGSVEDIAQAVPILCERMDNICSMMDYQSQIIGKAEELLEEAKFQYKRKELATKKALNEALVSFKQEDRGKPRNQKRTDPEYVALAELEAHISRNEALSSEREYLKSQHNLDNEKHRYETLNNHFLSYRKACDLLMKEMGTISGGNRVYDNR